MASYWALFRYETFVIPLEATPLVPILSEKKKQGSEWNELPPQQRRCARDSRNCLSVAIWLQIREVLAAISNGPPVTL